MKKNTYIIKPLTLDQRIKMRLDAIRSMRDYADKSDYKKNDDWYPILSDSLQAILFVLILINVLHICI